MIPLEDALRLVLEQAPRLAPESVALESARGRWLAEEVRADHDLPPADVSAMDGFAVRAADAASVPVTLRVVGEVRAGQIPDRAIGDGQAAHIMTGAPLPPGADAVQRVERTEPAEAGRVRLLAPVAPGENVRRRGENIQDGERLLPAGQRIGPAEVGLLALAGQVSVRVGRRPRVALGSTGDELVEPAHRPGPGRIRDANGPILRALAEAEGAEVVPIGILPDREDALDRGVQAASGADLLLLSGGVSMGTYDLVEPALRRAGVEVRFARVAVMPGKPTVFGTRPAGDGTTLVFGLPGNPVSCLVMFRLLVAPALRRMQGSLHAAAPRRRARLSTGLPATPRREAFHPARVSWTDSGYVAKPVAHHGSGDLVAWRQANAMVRLPAEASAAAGDLVEFIPDPEHDLR